MRERLLQLVDEICNLNNANVVNKKNLQDEKSEFFAEKVRTLGDIEAREKKVKDREDNLSGVMQTSAQRLTRIKALEENQATLNKQRLDAEKNARNANMEKTRLESVVATLIAEKNALLTELEHCRPQVAAVATKE